VAPCAAQHRRKRERERLEVEGKRVLILCTNSDIHFIQKDKERIQNRVGAVELFFIHTELLQWTQQKVKTMTHPHTRDLVHVKYTTKTREVQKKTRKKQAPSCTGNVLCLHVCCMCIVCVFLE